MAWIEYDLWKALTGGLRNYLTFNGVNSYIQLSEPKVFTGDFRIVIQTGLLKDSFSTFYSSSDTNSWLRMNSTTQFSYRNNDVEIGISVTEIDTSIVNTITLERDSTANTVSITINDGAPVISSHTGNNFVIDELGRQAGAFNRLYGSMFDVDVDDLTTPSNSVLIPINDGWVNNPDIKDSDGNVVGTLINGQESDWSRGNVL